MGKTGGHQWGESTAAYGENLMAAVTPASSSLISSLQIGAFDF
jgi:hypothetical protein